MDMKNVTENSIINLPIYNQVKTHEKANNQHRSHWFVFVTSSNNCEGFFNVGEDPKIIGKDNKQCNILAKNQSISKRHAMFSLLYNAATNSFEPVVLDLASTNGTYVNGVPIQPKTPVILKEYDRIQFGASAKNYIIISDDNLEHKTTAECTKLK